MTPEGAVVTDLNVLLVLFIVIYVVFYYSIVCMCVCHMFNYSTYLFTALYTHIMFIILPCYRPNTMTVVIYQNQLPFSLDVPSNFIEKKTCHKV